MNNLPLLIAPAGLAYLAYKGADCKFGSYHKLCEEIDSRPPAYKEKLSTTVPGFKIRRDMDEFLEKENVRKNLLFVEANVNYLCTSFGTNSFGKRAVIVLKPGFYGLDKDACRFIIKYEISVFKNNDHVFTPLVAAISSAVAGFFGASRVSWLPGMLLTMAVGCSAFISLSWFRALKADDFAIEKSTVKELLGGRRLVLAYQRIPRNRFDLFNPFLTSTIQKIEKELENRKVSIVDSTYEEEKTGRLKDLIRGVISINVENDIDGIMGRFL